ncbi:hypothetical protein CPB83DRAFT_895359 [Crepidotus variabilis]|uniref:Glutaredoxin domain-containing protein n=1 Tax=Crepidotus variabilis TaxID=179855 RepID=A0A9P6JP79_9AGAR|nr:hypothetical protein CPB83DRAFT_895359 [Crepidotus variabilis]
MDLPRVNSRTPLQIASVMFPLGISEPKAASTMTAKPVVAGFLAALHPRKPKQRSTFAALIFLVCLTTYIFIAHSTSLSSIAMRQPQTSAADQLAHALETIQKSRLGDENATLRPSHESRPQLQLDTQEELAAVSSFLASLPQNVIPPSVDPKVSIDPQLVLDFDTRSPRAKEEVRVMVDELWSRHPVFVYSKYFSPAARELKAILNDLYLKPAPTIIDVDVREDSDILTPMLARLTGTDLPVLLIGGKVIGSTKEARALLERKELQKMITEAGAQIDGAKRKKHRK